MPQGQLLKKSAPPKIGMGRVGRTKGKVAPVPTTPVLPAEFTNLPVPQAVSKLWPIKRMGKAGEIRPAMLQRELGTKMAYLKSAGFSPVALVNYVQGLGGARHEGETGYILSKLMKPSEVPNELRLWYTAEVAKMNAVLKKARKEAKRKIAQLKASGKDYTAADIERIYASAYPDWSQQHKTARELTQRHRAYAQQVAARLEARAQSALKITVNAYEVETQRGIKPFWAVNEDQARRLAESYGLIVKGITHTGEKTVSGTQAVDRIRSAQGQMRGAEAMLLYGAVLGYEIPEGSVPVKLGDSYQFITREVVEQLKALPTYKETKGNEWTKLGAAFSALASAIASLKPYITSFVTGIHGKVAGAEEEQYVLIKATPEEIQQAQQICIGAACPGDMVAFETYKAILQGGAVVYVEALDEKSAKRKAQEAGYDVVAVTFVIRPEDLGFQEVIDIPKLVEDKGASNATEMLEDAGITNGTDAVQTWQDIIDYDKEFGTNYAGTGLEEGFNTMVGQMNLDAAVHNQLLDKVKDYSTEEGIDIVRWLKDTKDEGALKALGVKQETIDSANEYIKETSPANIAKEVGLSLIPIYGTKRYYDKAVQGGWTHGERALLAGSIIADIAIILPIVRAIAAGARATTGVTVGAKVSGAARAAGQAGIAQIKAPFTMLLHPRQTAKGIYATFEALLHPKRVPLEACEISYSTVRLSAKVAGGGDEAIKLREAVTRAAIQGKKASVTIKGTTVTLSPTALQKVGKVVAVHSTPDIRPYLNGAIVKGGRQGGLYIAPNLHTRFSMASAFGDVPEGGMKGALVIRDQRVLDALTPSNKLYRSAAEIEAILPPGTVLPAPTQTLFTRDMGGDLLRLLVIGKPFTPKEVAQLRLMGMFDTIGNIFKPSVKVSKASRVGELGRVQRQTLDYTNVVFAQVAKVGLMDMWRTATGEGRKTVVQGVRVERLAPIDTRQLYAPVRTDINIGRRTAQSTRLDRLVGRVPDSRITAYRPPTITSYRPLYEPPYQPPSKPPYYPPSHPPYEPPIRPPYYPPVGPPLTPPIKPPHPPRLTIKGGKKVYKIPDGSIAWRQGLFWKYIPSPWSQAKPITLKYPPIGAKAIYEKTPQKTIQMIGKPKAKVAKSVSIDLGVVDIKIDNYGKAISFTGKGLETIAGGSVASTTKGMSIPATAPTKLKGVAKLAFGTSLRSLVAETYRDDIPKKFAEKALASKLSKMPPKEIAEELKASGVSRDRITEILKRVPDRVRKQVELWLSVKWEYAPTRGFPKVAYTPSILVRKTKPSKKVLTEKEVVPSTSALRV